MENSDLSEGELTAAMVSCQRSYTMVVGLMFPGEYRVAGSARVSGRGGAVQAKAISRGRAISQAMLCGSGKSSVAVGLLWSGRRGLNLA